MHAVVADALQAYGKPFWNTVSPKLQAGITV